MFYSVLYEKGQRENNQDSIALQRMKTRLGDVVLAVVCDGLGGEKRGEVASGYIAEEAVRWFHEEFIRLLMKGKRRAVIEHSLSRMFFHAHEDLRRYGLEKGIRCGTTMTMLLLIGERYITAQIGDSMAYRIGKRCGPLTPRQGQKAGVECCLGIGRYRLPVFRHGRYGRKDAFLLLSDGLLHGISERDIAGVLSPYRISDADSAERALKTIAGATVRRGGRDNMSAIYLW